ncbi:MAG: phosphohistidine swiveling domain-containing protein [Verrucomicrobiales bacterium]|jgi:phosphohistidine swiveling domain-containing protein
MILFSENITADCQIGGKARNLKVLGEAGFAVPEWFVIVGDYDGWEAGYDRLCPEGGLVAVRSSALAEDGNEHSFAGQFDSFLFVEREAVVEKIEAVWRSAQSDRVLAYQRERGVDAPPERPAVIVQVMVDADQAGVAFSADPVSGRRGDVVISMVDGVGDALVSGEVDGETFTVKRESGRQEFPSCVGKIAVLAREVEAQFGKPQDIEWAIRGGALFVLQSRPITSLANLPDPDAEMVIWDNSNIVESYCGVTTPMTFTFALRAYESVYREFCGLMRVPESRVAASDAVFGNMLGLVRGRVYYNLINWYRVLAMLPGFKFNRAFMEQMMGVKEPMPDAVVEQIEREIAGRGKFADLFGLLCTGAGLVHNHFTLERQVGRFYERLDDALKAPEIPLEQMRADELVAHYQDLEDRLLTRWDAPLVNDFLAMIFFGTLTKLCVKWCGDDDGTLQNDLIRGDGDSGIISTEPARRIKELAELAKRQSGVLERLESGEMCRDGEFGVRLEAYLEKFGDRCLEELKLESPTLLDDPSSLLGAIVAMAKRPPMKDTPVESRPVPKLGFLKHVLFNWTLKHARQRVRDRENLRFERTRLFGRVRRILVELGKRLAADGVLGSPRDVFYLELPELLGFFKSTASSNDLAGLVAVRRAEFDRFRNSPVPPDRFETFGAPGLYREFTPSRRGDAEPPSGESLSGIGCCPGIVRGRAKLVMEPRGAKLEPGDILVAQQTDPGWVMLFPAAAGLVVERGSLLSHSAIVSREMGIPSVVSLSGLCEWIEDGEIIEIDGAAGTVRKVGSDG